MTTRWVALIRGINVGRARRVAMADLRQALEAEGYEEVRTVLNSGNVILTASRTTATRLAARIEGVLAGPLGVPARVVCMSGAELAEALSEAPLASRATDPSRLLIAVPTEPDTIAALAPLARKRWTPEALAVGGRVVWLWCPGGVLASQLAREVSRALDEAVTMRNWTTMQKITALARP